MEQKTAKIKEKLELTERENRVVKEFKRENGVVRLFYERDQDGVDIDNIDLKEQKELRVKDIVFIQADGKEFSLASLLPTGIELIESKGKIDRIAEFWQRSGVIVFTRYFLGIDDSKEGGELVKRDLFTLEGALYVMLHEIGHIAQAGESEWERYDQLHDLALDGNLKDKDIGDYVLMVLAMEKQAHIFAIKELRRLRREGIELEPHFKQLKDLKDLVHGGLAYYERLLSESMDKANSEE